jgi:uncharacterized protein YfdQ (DUF2303 family)
MTESTTRNLADSLAEYLPQVQLLDKMEAAGGGALAVFAMPRGTDLKEIDTEKLLANPRRAKGQASTDNPESFIEYVERHKSASTVVWCKFDPQTYALSFTAVFDDHAKGLPGWRGHRAFYQPAMSAEWNTWTGQDGKLQNQLAFAEFLERHADDINTGEPPIYPSSPQMLAMATQFEATSDKRIKSAVRLSSGGVRINYVDDDAAGTVEQMSAFEKFQIGIPVFWAGKGYRIVARLKWRQREAALNFFYELVRPDLAHETAARELIQTIEMGIAEVPLLMGDMK